MSKLDFGAGRCAAVVRAVMAALVLSAATAQAGTIGTATYKGTITQLLDKDALLGTVIDTRTAASLAFTNVFTFDLGEGLRFSSATDDNLLGGPLFGATSPVLSS